MSLLYRIHHDRLDHYALAHLFYPFKVSLDQCPILKAKGCRPLQMTFEDQLKIPTYYHLEEYSSGLQVLKQENFAATHIAPPGGIEKSAFFEAINTRGPEQMVHVYEDLQKQATKKLPVAKEFSELGDLIAVDGSLITATMSMLWADYRNGANKAKVHLGFDIGRGIPQKVTLTDGKGDERPQAERLVAPGQTDVYDRYYQCYKNFDDWQDQERHFVCRIKASSRKTELRINEVDPDSHIFYDAVVLLGTKTVNQTNREVRVVGYKADGKSYWVATDRFDLTAEHIALNYKLRWTIESFFAWWKRHLKVYHLIARSPYGLLMQILTGLISSLLLAIYCHEEYGGRVSVNRVRELLCKIRNEAVEDAANRGLDPPDIIDLDFGAYATF
ncbi:IS4 family transposase [uncultured Desulfuromusa sp.]|uniref:IS4 family transposase n=1 Tax=uncultured Desulfuromusa sp. TaxID=219183 RepID=UPI00374A2640